MSAVIPTWCVDCGTPIIGEGLRCPACHDRHARSVRSPMVVKILVGWFVTVQTVAIVAALLFLAGRSCT